MFGKNKKTKEWELQGLYESKLRELEELEVEPFEKVTVGKEATDEEKAAAKAENKKRKKEAEAEFQARYDKLYAKVTELEAKKRAFERDKNGRKLSKDGAAAFTAALLSIFGPMAITKLGHLPGKDRGPNLWNRVKK